MATDPTDEGVPAPVGQTIAGAARARRRRRRRRAATGVAVAVVVVAGAGSAWALSGSSGPSYRTVAATRGDVAQTVDADGTLAARRQDVAAFASSGTVQSVAVAVGDHVTAGQRLASLDATALQQAIVQAQATLAQARQRLADDEDAQASGTTTAAVRTTTTSTTVTATLVAAYTSAAASTSTSPGGGASDPVQVVKRDQQLVVAAQHALDGAITAQDSAVADVVKQCAASDDPMPVTALVTAGNAGTVSGASGSSDVVVSLRDTSGSLAQTSSANPQRVGAGGIWSFAGLQSGTAYRVAIERAAVISTTDCVTAAAAVSSAQQAVDGTHTALDRAITALSTAVAALPSSGGTSGGGTSGGTGSGGGGTGGGSGSSGSGTGGSGRSGSTGAATGSGTTGGSFGATTSGAITAEQIAADSASIDAAQAEVAVARQNRSAATLTATISGTVAAVGLSAGDSVSANSSSSTITVVGTGALAVDLSIGIADIDQVKVGQHAAVTVDGRTEPVPATVSYVGVVNTSSSTGSASSYPVTVQLDRSYAGLYDGMGASVAISVGTAKNALTVPVSALHAFGSTYTVQVLTGSTVTVQRVQVGVLGADRAQVTSGLKAGQRVVLADIGAAVPSSTTSTRGFGSGGTFSGLTGSTGGPGGFTGGGFSGGGFRGGGR